MLLAAWPALAAQVNVTLTNTTHNSYFTPLLITAHDPAISLFELGRPAGDGLRAMAEGGDISGLSAAVGGADADTVENPAGGLLGPGETISADLDTDASGHAVISLVAMILPTNDGFVGWNSAPIPATPGTYIYSLNAYDAGTEANDEIVAADGGVPGNPGFPNPPAVGLADSGGTGVTLAENNPTVHIHRGVLGDTNPTGGISDIDSTRYRWLNPVARVVLTVR
jgi:hypothetical protein